MTSLTCSIRPMTRASCETDATWSVAMHDRGVIRGHRHVRGHDVDLALGDALAMSLRSPVRSWASTRIAIG